MKSLINFALYKEQLKRFWLGGALLTFIYTMYIITFFTENRQSWQLQQSIWRIIEIINMQGVIQVAIVVVPLGITFLLFSHLFNPSANIALHSFPMDKKQVFLTNVLVGVTLIVVPVLIFSFLLWINPLRIPEPIVVTRFPEIIYRQHTFFPPPFFPENMNELSAASDRIVTFSMAFAFFWRVVVAKIFYFAIFSLATSLAGNRIGKLMFCGALPFLPMLGIFIYAYAIEFYMVGHTMRDGRLVYHILFGLNPVMWNAYTSFLRINTVQLFLFALYIVQIIIYLALALFFQHIRKLENTGELVVFRPIKNAVIFIASAIGMVLAGFFTVGVIFDGGSRVVFYLAFIPGFVISYTIVQMIAEKSFMILHKIKAIVPYATSALVAYLLLVLIARVSISTDVPRQENITRVSIVEGWTWGQQFLSDNPEVITLVREAHQIFVDEISYLNRLNWNDIFVSGRWENTVPIHIRYQMENGREIHRSYWVSRDFVRRTGLYDILGHRALLELQQPFLRYRNYIESIVIRRNTNTVSEGFQVQIQNDVMFVNEYAVVQSLIDAIARDVVDFYRETSQWFSTHFEHSPELPESFNEWRFIFSYNQEFLRQPNDFRWMNNFDQVQIVRPGGYVENWIAENWSLIQFFE